MSVTDITHVINFEFSHTTICANLAISAGTSLEMSRKGERRGATDVPPDADRTIVRDLIGVVDAEETPRLRESIESLEGKTMEAVRGGDREFRTSGDAMGGFGGARKALISGVDAEPKPIMLSCLARPSLMCFDCLLLLREPLDDPLAASPEIESSIQNCVGKRSIASEVVSKRNARRTIDTAVFDKVRLKLIFITYKRSLLEKFTDTFNKDLATKRDCSSS